MAVASLVVAIIALLASGASVFYTWRQADASRQMAALDRERRRDELKPAFRAEIEEMGSWYRLRLRQTSGGALSRVRVEIVRGGDDVVFTVGQNGVGSGGIRPRAAVWDSLSPADPGATWRISLDKGEPRTIGLEVTCCDGRFTWDRIPVEFEAPYDVTTTFGR